jgi:hypothetical protein
MAWPGPYSWAADEQLQGFSKTVYPDSAPEAFIKAQSPVYNRANGPCLGTIDKKSGKDTGPVERRRIARTLITVNYRMLLSGFFDRLQDRLSPCPIVRPSWVDRGLGTKQGRIR